MSLYLLLLVLPSSMDFVGNLVNLTINWKVYHCMQYGFYIICLGVVVKRLLAPSIPVLASLKNLVPTMSLLFRGG